MPQNSIKKILFFITKSNFGGAQRYVYDLATNLPKNQFEIKVASGGNGSLKEKLNRKNIQTIEINYLERSISVFRDIRVFFKIIKILREEKPDIIHLNSSKIGGLGSLAGRICGVNRIVFTAHGWAFNEDRPYFAKIILKFLYLLTFWFSHSIIAVSDITFKQISNFPFNKQKVSIIHNGIDEINFKSKGESREKIIEKIKR